MLSSNEKLKINQGKAKEIDVYMKRIDSSHYVETLFDPIQTHAVKGVRNEDVDEVKDELKKRFGAVRFRVVRSGFRTHSIVCFKIKIA